MKQRFEDKSVLITGAGGGIGRATALLFAEEGARLTLVDRNEDDAKETARQVERAGGRAVSFGADVSKHADCEAMVKEAVATFGRIDVAFNNAGVGGSGYPIAEEEDIAWESIVGTNLKGVYLSMKCEIPEMLKVGGGTIVNTASVAGLIGEPGIASYTASKHGVVGLTRATALDYIRKGIRVNCICPGATLTPMLLKWFQDPEVEKFVLGRVPFGRACQPDEIGRAVLFLASDESSYVVGHALAVDGGLTAQ